MTEYFATPDETPEIRASELQSSLGERLTAQAADALDPKNSLSGMWFYRRIREGLAGGFAPHDFDGLPGAAGMQIDAIESAARAAIPDTSIDDAKARVKQEGLDGHLTLPSQPSIKTPVLDLMIQEAHERRDREAAIARGPQGFIPDALGVVTSIGAGMIDPVNAAAFSIPVLGEARMGRILASAGDSILARAGVRTAQGAVQGAVGSTLLQPADWWLHTRDGQDYTMADALKSVVMGAGMGGALHAGIGTARDVFGRLRGQPLPGSPEDLVARGEMPGRHLPAELLHDDGVTAGELAGTLAPEPPPHTDYPPDHPARLLEDLPPAAQEDIVRSAIADITAGRPVRAAEMLQVAAGNDPRIAESFEAFHGSPHDFDAFDSSNIGSGEGFQSYGHGLYFAENDRVARSYQRTTSDKVFIDKVASLYDESFSPDEAWAEIKANWKDFSPQEQRLMTALEEDDWLGFDYPHHAVSQALRSINNYEVSPETAAAARAMGNMYRVRINADREHFLDWDKPLNEQVPFVREAIDRAMVPFAGTDAYTAHPDLGGRSPMALLTDLAHAKYAGGRAQASAALEAAGIPGVKYFDHGSRANGEGTRNYVVFDDRHIEITHKNGEPVAKAELPPKMHALSAEARNWPQPPEGARIVAQGDHGPELEGLAGRWNEARDWLMSAQTGDARGVLEHPGVPGRIDVIWGDARGGLAHIVEQHREMLADLPERLATMDVVSKSANRINLAGEGGRAAIRLDYDGRRKTWLLTAFDPKERRGPGGEPGLKPATDLQAPLSRHYGGDGAGPTPIIGAPARTSKPRGRAAAHPDTLSLTEHLASRGGLRPDPELKVIYGNDRGPFLPGFGPLIRKTGMTLDDALTSAKEHGYMFDPHDAENGTAGTRGREGLGLIQRDLLDALDAESRGRKLYKAGHVETTKYDPEQEKHVILGALEQELEASGAKVSDIDPALLDRTVEIVHRERVGDVLEAYERAIMEDAERYEKVANARRSNPEIADIPGWDHPDDAGAARSDGADHPLERWSAGRPEQGAGGGNGAQSSRDGAGIRNPDRAAADPAWRRLADVQPDYNDPVAVAESKAADLVGEPASTVPEKSLTAAEKAAADAEVIWRKLEPTLTDKERKLVNDVLDQLKLDNEARAQIITDGAACLAGAVL